MLKSKFRIYITVFLVIIITIWLFRNKIFLAVFEKAISRAENRFGFDITYNKAKLTGLRTIIITKLNIEGQNNTSVINSDSIVLALKPFNLILGNVRFRSISVYNTKVSLNYEFLKLLRQKKHNQNQETLKTGASVNYSEILNELKHKLFSYLPKEIIFRNIDFSYQNKDAKAIIRIENFNYIKNFYLGEMLFIDNQINKRCITEGTIDPDNYTISCKISRGDSSSLRLPYLGPKWQASLGFDTLQFNCNFKEHNKNAILKGIIKTNNLAIYYKQIGPDTVITRFGEMDFDVKIGDRFIEVDSSTVVMLNTFHFSPYVKFEKHSSPKITFAFIKNEFNADDLFKSLPEGLFSNFKGLKTKGKLEYQMRLFVDLNIPDSVKFYSNLENKGFKIQQYGVTDFRLLNGPFIHEVYENGYLAAAFQVGPENPDFVPLAEISPYLRYSILTSEDGDFFYHHGFNMGAFRESIAKNIKEKRFARGGSTISMQLIKNVFLSRKKTYSRKLEEALIVWMIENQHLVSKERMFEVYLNIIEWGPGIYGVKPAAWFYFKKHPKDLTLSESIFLTSIIPRPKGFKYMFDQDGRLRDFLTPYYNLLSGIMVRRNQILPEDTLNLQPITGLTGEAKKLLQKPDSMHTEDSLFYIKPLEIGPMEY